MVHWEFTFVPFLNCYPFLKIRLRPIRQRSSVYMTSDNPVFCLGIVNCSLHTRRKSLKDNYHDKRIDMLSYTTAEFNFLNTPSKTFIIPTRRSHFTQGDIFNNAAARRIAIAIKTHSVFTGSFTQRPFWYEQFDLRQIGLLRCGQPFVDLNGIDNCGLCVTTMKSNIFQDDIPSISNEDFKDQFLLVFELTSIEDATGNCKYPELVREPLTLELNLTFLLEHLPHFIVSG